MSVATNLLPSNTSGIETDTSGWTAGANTTLSKSSRFYTGAASLGMTATAAGSVTATTSARVAVVAGQEYTAYSYWANVVAATGRSATVRVDWYAAVSGGSAISSVTSAASSLPNATTWQTPPPILIGTAPVGAQYASVTVSCSGLTAGATVVTDVISLGPPQTPSGNLLPYNTASVEVSTAAWSAYTNAVVSRSSEAAWEGWHSLVATSVAAGPMDIGQAPLVSVTPGVEYVASAVVRPDVASTVRVDLRWYDASSALMSQSDTPWSAPAGTWTTCTTIGIAPPGAAFARLVLHPVATDVGQRWLFDRMALRPAPTPVGSLIGYNIASMEVDASGWSAIAGCTVERSTDRWWEGSASLKITADGTTDAWVGTTAVIPVTPRVSYSATPMVWAAASTATRIFVTRLTWQNSAGEDIRISDFRWRIVAGASGWFVLPSSGAAPDAASSVRVSVAFEAPTAGDVYHIDAVDVVPGGVSAIADPLPDQYGARITLSGLTTDAHTYWGLWRADATGDRTPVRGSTGDTSQMLITGDSTIVEDFEAPLGVPTTYVLALWTPAGSSRRTTSDAIVIPEPAPSEVVLKDPGLPARQTTAAVSKGGQPQWTRRARQGVNAVRGRSRPIVISDVRTSREGTMTLVTETTEDLASMWWLLETGNVLLIQWPSLWGERDVYVSVGDVTEAPIVGYAEYRDRTWTVPLTEVDRPIGGATGAADRTWQAVATDHTSWTDVSTTYRSWLGVYTGVEGT